MKESFEKTYKPGEQIEIDFSQAEIEAKEKAEIEAKARIERLEVAEKFGASPEKLLKGKRGKWYILEDYVNKIVPLDVWYKRKEREKEKEKEENLKKQNNESNINDLDGIISRREEKLNRNLRGQWD